MNPIKENNFLSLFLFDSKYRVWRHLLFIVVTAIITFNQVFLAYQDCQEILSDRIYLICLGLFVLYLIALYFNYLFLTPRFLLKGRYIAYSVTLGILVFSLPTISIWAEYRIRSALDLPHRISSYTSPLILIDNLAFCMLTGICFCGVSFILVLRTWISGHEYVSRLEGEHLQSELNKLKGQISPAFLSKTFRNAAAIVETNPEGTTGMLMELGQLLRYQLYDCNRDRILLKTEINFLTKFLELERLNNLNLQYRIHIEGDMSNIFISPMLLLSLVQYTIKDSALLNLFFKSENGVFSFICQSDNKTEWKEEELFSIKKRLELQYPEKYMLIVNPGMIELKINGGE